MATDWIWEVQKFVNRILEFLTGLETIDCVDIKIKPPCSWLGKEVLYGRFTFFFHEIKLGKLLQRNDRLRGKVELPLFVLG